MTWDERIAYPAELDSLSPAEMWARWEAGEATVWQMWMYQDHQRLTFGSNGEIVDRW